ncbi:MAG: 4Fe-4S binding protein, partial [Calditrichaeota bacterium]
MTITLPFSHFKESMSIYRRLSQIFFLLFFVWVVVNTRYPGPPLLPADTYLLASPLLSLSTIMAAREITWITIPGLAILMLTIVWGRFFCGWICPLGTTLDATDKLFRRRPDVV